MKPLCPRAREHSGLDSSSSSRGRSETVEATTGRDLLLQLRHALLVTGRIGRISLQSPLQVGIGVVRLEARVEDAETLAVRSDLVPVTLHILHVLAEVGKGTLEDLAVQLRAHDGLEVDIVLVRLRGRGEDVVGSLLDSAEESLDFLRIFREKLLVAFSRLAKGSRTGTAAPTLTNVKNAAEAAAAELSQLVNA